MSATLEHGPGQRVIGTAAGALLEGDLTVPSDARGVVLLPHGSGISRSAGDAFVARKLYEAGLGTLLVELLTADEQNLDARLACFRFDIALLADRLAGVGGWLAEQSTTRGLPIGCFAAGNAAAAAFVVAARTELIGALVTYSGRPDLAEQDLGRVRAATRLVVDGSDEPLIGLNRTRLEQFGAEHKEFVLVPGTATLFEDPGVSEEVARLAAEWFTAHLRQSVGGEANGQAAWGSAPSNGQRPSSRAVPADDRYGAKEEKNTPPAKPQRRKEDRRFGLECGSASLPLLFLCLLCGFAALREVDFALLRKASAETARVH